MAASTIRVLFFSHLILTTLIGCAPRSPATPSTSRIELETDFLENIRQVTFAGRRAGEGYFSADGRKIVFQSERNLRNPFYQIYTLDRDSSPSASLDSQARQISPGIGKTTCAWLHPDGKRILFSSTHLDPKSQQLMRAEMRLRASGKARPYQWDYDPHYDIFEATDGSQSLKNLTKSPGYDAEGSYSPDGNWIVFSSNRHAYSSKLSTEDRAKRDADPSLFLDLYLMRSDGSHVQRLTSRFGYDGGPFFSADGRSVVWRHFEETGRTAEIYTLRLDDPTHTQQQVTKMGVLSWAPYLHPSGDYIVFATNVLGMKNFEVYLVDAAGQKAPVRVTRSDGFDGLPVFSPDGRELLWTSARNADKNSQLYIADWNDTAARTALGLPQQSPPLPQPATAAQQASLQNLKSDINNLASVEMTGRRAGTHGEELATNYAQKHFAAAGLIPAGDANSYFQSFSFQAGAAVSPTSTISLGGRELELEKDWRPISFSASGQLPEAALTLVGYGMVVPPTVEVAGHDDYAGLNVKDRWVVAFRGYPEQTDSKHNEIFHAHMSLREKARIARERGARGIIFVTGPKTSGVTGDVVPWRVEAGLTGRTSIFAISLSKPAAAYIFDPLGGIEKVQNALDAGARPKLPPIVGPSGRVVIKQEAFVGRNVIGRVPSLFPKRSPLIIGAHIDHLGVGHVPESSSKDLVDSSIHFGADDNASGSATVLELARQTAAAVAAGSLVPERDIIFALWSGEELGLLGSAHFTSAIKIPGRGLSASNSSKTPFFANLNFDMVGRLRESLALQGVGSSITWRGLLEAVAFRHRLAVTLNNDSHLPTDSTSFYSKGVPILTAFTGLHTEYHTPQDIPELINYEGLVNITNFAFDLLRTLATTKLAFPYTAIPPPKNFRSHGSLAVTLGTVPDYTSSSQLGMLLSGVHPGGPADKAGLKTGDIVVAVGEDKIENIYDYTAVLARLTPNKIVAVTVLRGEERLVLSVTPQSRE